MEVLYEGYIPCVPPGAICDIVYVFWRKYLERIGELGRVVVEEGVDRWYEGQYFEMNLRRYKIFPGGFREDIKFGKLRVESIWQENKSYVRLLGSYWGKTQEEYNRYIDAKNKIIGLLDDLRIFATRYCGEVEIRVIVIMFIEQRIKVRLV